MNFRQLETFRVVADLGSFTRAAQHLNMTQSTVSLRIAELEQDLGVLLLDRSARRVRVTAKGRDLLRYAAEIKHLVAEVRQTVGDPKMVTGSIRIGAAELIALTWLPDFITRISAAFPRLEADLEVGMSGDMSERLREGAIDLALIPLAGEPSPEFSSHLLRRIPFAYHGGPLSGTAPGPLRPGDFERLTLISLGKGSEVSSLEKAWFAQVASPPLRLTRSNSMEISAGLVRSGLGVSLLPVEFYASDCAAGQLTRLDAAPPLKPVPFYALHRRADAWSIVARAAAMATKAASGPWAR